jgi:hypothetical protein
MWMDDKGKKSRLSAPQYVDYVMTYVQKTANDEAIFPTKVRISMRVADPSMWVLPLEVPT